MQRKKGKETRRPKRIFSASRPLIAAPVLAFDDVARQEEEMGKEKKGKEKT